MKTVKPFYKRPIFNIVIVFLLLASAILIINFPYFRGYYYLSQSENFKLICCKCTSVKTERNYEIYKNAASRLVKTFLLDNGDTVSVYENLTNISETISDEYFTNTPLKYTYIPKESFDNGQYLLVSIEDEKNAIVSSATITDYYSSVVKTDIITLIICMLMLIFVFIIAPIICKIGIKHLIQKR